MMTIVSAVLKRIIGLIHCCLVKLFHFKSFRFHFIELIAPTAKLSITNSGRIFLGKGVGAHRGCEFSANGGLIEIGAGCFFNNAVILVAHQKIVIGDGTIIGPYVQIYDHDHDYKAVGGVGAQEFIEDEVVIGKNVWIGANTVILRGTKIGDNCIVGAGCVIKGNFEKDTLIV